MLIPHCFTASTTKTCPFSLILSEKYHWIVIVQYSFYLCVSSLGCSVAADWLLHQGFLEYWHSPDLGQSSGFLACLESPSGA